MTTATQAKKELKTLAPLRPSHCDFGAYQHKVNQFSVVVPGNLKKDDLENHELWVNQARLFSMGCEVRALADDMSFVAYCICTYAQGSTAKLKVISFDKLDEVDADALTDATQDYEVKLRGPKKWSIVQKSTGAIIKEDIPTQLEAMKELSDYQRALSS